MAHSSKFPGLQEHSVGPFYPWSTVHIGGDRDGIIPRNLLDNREGPFFPYSTPGSADFDSTFDLAYAYAEQWIRLTIRVDAKREVEALANAESRGPYVDAMIDLAELGYPQGDLLVQSPDPIFSTGPCNVCGAANHGANLHI